MLKAIRKSKLIAPALLVGMCLMGKARADVEYQIVNSTADMETFNVAIDGNTINGALAGGIQIVQVGGDGAGLPSTYTTVCTDISGSLYLGQAYWYKAPVSFSNESGVKPKWGADNAGGLVDQASADKAIQNAAELFYKHSGGMAATGLQGSDAVQMAGLQLAVWEALYDTSSSGQVVLGGGTRFQVAPATGDQQKAIDDATALINGLNSSGLNGNYGLAGSLFYPNPADGSMNRDGEPPQSCYWIRPPCPSLPPLSPERCCCCRWGRAYCGFCRSGKRPDPQGIRCFAIFQKYFGRSKDRPILIWSAGACSRFQISHALPGERRRQAAALHMNPTQIPALA